MTYIIAEPCVDVKDKACVEVCPVDCIHPGDYNGEVFMVIDPDSCIDCTLCKPACPIDAIVETEDDDPEWAAINAELAEEFMENDPVEMRDRDDPPRKPGNEIVNP